MTTLDTAVDAPPRVERLPGSRGGWFGRASLHTALIIVCLIWLLPTVSLFVSSLRPANEVLTTGWWNAFRLPFEFTLDNYREVLFEKNMAQSFVNSLLITIPATVIPILVGGTADVAPMTVTIANLVNSLGQGYHLLTAAAFISMVLPLIVFIGLQRYFVRGILGGSVKG